MAEYSTINTVAAASVATVNSVAKASIANIHGLTTPVLGASQWVCAYEDGGVGYAANSDLSSWTTYYSGDVSESVDWQGVAFGKDDSNNDRYLFVWTRGSNPGEVRYTNDITNTSGFTATDISASTGIDSGLYCVEYINGVWLAAGKMDGNAGNAIWRSTDGGAQFSEIETSNLTGIGSTGIYALAHDGDSTVIFTQDEVVYYSTDKGATWAVALAELNSSAKGLVCLYIKDEGTFVVGYYKNGLKFRTCAANAPTTWTAQVNSTDSNGNKIGVSSSAPRKAFAAAGSTFVVANAQSHQRFTVSGQTITRHTYTEAQLPYANVTDMSTDGTTWLAVHKGGDFSKSTDDGATWTSAAQNVFIADQTTDDDLYACVPNVAQPV